MLREAMIGAPTTPGVAAQHAWAQGETGLPFLDAAMRYLNATGWLNYRLREMVAAVAVQQLGLDWRSAGAALARRFTDYEPGILWPLMAAPARAVNPVKLGLQLDPTGVFTRHWLPELACVPDEYVQSPWKWHGAGRILGRKYPEPITAPTIKLAPSRPRAKKVMEIVLIEGVIRRTAQMVMEF